MSSTFNKDFYTYLPLWIQNILDMKILLYRDEGWFETAWNRYRDACYKVKMRDIPDPDRFFSSVENEFHSNGDTFEERTKDILGGSTNNEKVY